MTEGTETDSAATVVRVPQHVAIVMDGNGRWAQRHGKKRHAGHKEGVKSVRRVVEQAAKAKVKILTVFAFSSENWRRPREEVGLLMDLFMLALKQEIKRLQRNNVRLKIIGDRSRFSQDLQASMAKAELDTAGNSGLILQVAANYGGRWDMTQAVRSLAQQVRDGSVEPNAITEEHISAELSFSDLPDPDLFIRTGGEQRLSNFLLWQSAYAELYFTDVLWPDFHEAEFDAALAAFATRQRRFGLVAEQVTSSKETAG
ncbi:MAG: isoprenyl transferase [Gammaproteobacteria bacterium]|nr:isoprenyl transferase [Gammaproteobacteria bacterium]